MIYPCLFSIFGKRHFLFSKLSDKYYKEVFTMPSEKILEQKKAVVADLSDKMSRAASGVLVKYQGITVDEAKFAEKMEEEGKITVIRPIRPVEVGRMEKDTAKLAALYQEGYDIASQFISLIRQ